MTPDVPPVLAEICDRATALDRRARYQSALEMQQALESYLDGCWEPVDRRELAELLGRTFALERASMRRCIERQLHASGLGRGRQSAQRRRWPLFALLPVLAGWWGRLRSWRRRRSRSVRWHGPPALAVLATAALVAVVWSTGSRSPGHAPPPRARPDPGRDARPPAPAPLRPLPAPVVTPAPTTLTAGAHPRQVAPQVRPTRPGEEGSAVGAPGASEERLLGVPAGEVSGRGSALPAAALDEEDPYAP